MKRILTIFLCCFMLLGICGCGGNFAQVDLQNAIDLPEDGIVKASVFRQIKEENAIAVFQGESNSILYEWTVFASDISECRDINLRVDIEEREDEELFLTWQEQDALDFSGLLSIHLKEPWEAQSASVYQDGEVVGSVSITGSKETILNLSMTNRSGTCRIIPDIIETDEILAEADKNEDRKPEVEVQTKDQKPEEDSYLSYTADADDSGKVLVSETKAAQQNSQKLSSETKKEDDDTASDYLSVAQNSVGRVYSDGSRKEKDKYQTDPIPVGKPLPVEPEDQEINDEKTYTCTFSIECSTILNNLSDLDPDKLEMVPSNGTILKKTTVKFYEGESVYDVLQRVCEENGIHMEASWTPIYNSAYVEGIHNLYEFDCGSLSGWMYKVNGWYPNYGCSRYRLKQGDKVEWRYTCDLGHDVGGAYAVGG